MKKFPDSFEAIDIEHNVLIENICGGKILEQCHNQSLSHQESSKIRKDLDHHAFQNYANTKWNLFELLESRDYQKINQLFTENYQEFVQRKIELIEELINIGPICIILARQELVEYIDSLMLHLSKLGFDLFYEKDIEVDIDKFRGLYNNMINVPKKEEFARRRAFGYMNRVHKVLLLKGNFKNITNGYQMMDFFKEKFKGVSGEFLPNSIRGDIVYRRINQLIGSQSKNVMFTLDPIMQFNYYDHGTADKDMRFYYNLPGIHSPESNEITKDMGFLMDANELEKAITQYRLKFEV